LEDDEPMKQLLKKVAWLLFIPVSQEHVPMIFSGNSTLSSLKAYDTKMTVSANNVANVETEGFKKSRAIFEEGTGGAVEVQVDRMDASCPLVQVSEDYQYVAKEMSNVDLGEEIPQTILAQRGYGANLTMVEVSDEMLGSLLDILT
jgi:flagellar basal-body rod protein FlgC